LSEAKKLTVPKNHFYYMLLGELYSEIDNEKAKENFEKAVVIAKTESEKQLIKQKIKNL